MHAEVERERRMVQEYLAAGSELMRSTHPAEIVIEVRQRDDDALRLACAAAGEKHIERVAFPHAPRCVVAPARRNRRHFLRCEEHARLRDFHHPLHARCRRGDINRHIRTPRFHRREKRDEHLRFLVPEDGDGHAPLAQLRIQPSGDGIRARAEFAVSHASVVADVREFFRRGADPFRNLIEKVHVASIGNFGGKTQAPLSPNSQRPANVPPMSDATFSHLDETGTARMVDVGHKPVQRRVACAEGFVYCAAATIEALRAQALPKGDVLAVARIAGILAAKRCDELIPLCHSLPLDSVDVEFFIEAEAVRIRTTARTTAKTGVEMEALTAASVAALTIYDMCKAVDKGMTIGGIRVTEKRKE